MARRGAHGRMFQAAFQCAELPDRLVELGSFFRQQHAVDLRRWSLAEHRTDLVERESRHLAKRDQREAAEDILAEGPSKPATPQRLDQALLLVEAQGRRGDPRLFCDLGDFDQFHA